MSTLPPARIGASLDEVETPGLVVDLDTLETNLATMARRVAQITPAVALFPHAKTHKTTEIAHLQMQHGAQGICCQTVAEAEGLARSGIPAVMLTNQIVSRGKARRLAEIARRTTLFVCVDDELHISVLGRAADANDATIEILVEIDVGGGRCGVTPGTRAADLAELTERTPGLHFAGLQAYHAVAQHLIARADRETAIAGAVAAVQLSTAELTERGLACGIVAGAGTGSFELELASGVYTHLQCGSYAVMDVSYEGIEMDMDFAHALFLLTTVISSPGAGHAICDAGLKAFSVDSGLPVVHGRSDIEFVHASDEHGKLAIPDTTLDVGTRLSLVPGHCDPTVGMHDWIVAARDGVVEALWPVLRGR